MDETNKDRDNRVKWIKHYSSSHKILLVGEGDFSFSLCLAKAFGSASNMVATSLDSKEMVIRMYSSGKENLKELEERGCVLLHEVNVHAMNKHPMLHMMNFDQIVFNFPHAGFTYKEHDMHQIRLHQKVMRGFMKNAVSMLKEDGEVHVTHKTAYPFSEWKIAEIANNVGLVLVAEDMFSLYDYQGYENKRGEGYRCDDSFPVGQCSTFKFRKSYSVRGIY